MVDDSYNSNPRSLISMVRTVAEAREQVKRRVIIAGEMMELGPDAPAMHREVGREIAKLGVDVLWGARGLGSEIVAVPRKLDCTARAFLNRRMKLQPRLSMKFAKAIWFWSKARAASKRIRLLRL